MYVGGCSGIEIGREAKWSWLDEIPSSVDTLTLVMEPEEDVWGDTRWRFRRVAAFEGRLDPDLLWDGIARALVGNAGVLEIVGIESIDRDWTRMSIEKEKEAIRWVFGKALRAKGWSDLSVAERVKGLQFVERREFDKRLF